MKESIPIDKYGIFADTLGTDETGQWVYVIEKSQNQVKIGVTTNLELRIRTLESQGGFRALRVESSAHIKMATRLSARPLEGSNLIG